MTITDTRAHTRANTFAQSAMLVADREVRMRLRSKAFIVSSAILLLAVVASIVAGSIFGASASSAMTRVAVVGDGAALAQVASLEVTTVGSVDEAERLVRAGDVEAAIVPGDGPTGLQIVALDEAPGDLVQLLSASPEVTLLEPADQNSGLAYLVGLGFGIVFFMAATLFGTTIAQSVVEEKSTRVVEILMSAISARALLAGKVIGNTFLAFGQIVLIAAAAIVGLVVTGQDALLGDLGPSIVWFVVFFAVGFVLLAALFASAAALVSRQEDIGSVTTPVMMLVMIPYFLIVFAWDNDLVLTIMSYVPFSAPIGMPMRIYLGTAEWWEPLLSLLVILATTVVVVLFGSKIYANSLLRTGARVKVLEALRG
ncbi:ABC transporter permease [Agreia sp. VKM Ac-1783]|uniref:ABC transporter permease n=1 Tax=Agreia sp. VKM Ac-1783 TaxID=1938889 RepID=UPI000A2AE68A|nr:ABC transporter permease [Agreia sp. VKM Ac-1783]SMQ71173.1 ABC-2 type transport system permease protein [Agreia sp. VKM Ac-1783]